MSSQQDPLPGIGWIAGEDEFEEPLRLQELEDARNSRRTELRQNEKIGDTMSGDRNVRRTRLVFHNANGYNLKGGQGGKFREACQSVSEMGADYFGVQEHNLDANKPTVKVILLKTT